MEIVYRKLSDLHLNPKNPRTSTPEAVKALAESIKANPAFFEARPILLSDRTGKLVIIGGERRSEAAALLKMKSVPTILIPGLTEAREDEILIKDNSHAGEWDNIKLQNWLWEDLKKWGVLDWNEVTEKELQGLFEQEQKKAVETTIISIEIPAEISVDEIKDKVSEILQNYPKCRFK